jgi:hypothetical protein
MSLGLENMYDKRDYRVFHLNKKLNVLIENFIHIVKYL